MLNLDPIVALTLFAVAALAGTLTIAVYRTLVRPEGGDEFDEVLARVTGGDLDEDTALARTGKPKGGWSWNGWWLDAAQRAGREVEDPDNPGRVMLGAVVVSSLFGYWVYPGEYPGLYLGVVAILVGRFWLGVEQGRRKHALEKQMPVLLSALRTQMHAGVTVQGALLQVTDSMPAPMGQELQHLKNDITVGVSLEVALKSLGDRMHSRIMQFLVASIGVALKSGSDLVPQLVTIEEIVQQRARIQGKVRSAIALAKPTSYLAMAAPPAMAGWMAISDPDYLAYFFGPGMLVGLIGLLLYGAGVVVLQIMVKGVDKI